MPRKYKPKKIRVLEVDQFHGAFMMQEMRKGEIYNINEFSLDGVNGGDSEAAKKIFGGRARIYEVEKTDKSCHWGCARFRIKWTGRLDNVYWSTNWDSSG